MTLREHRLAAEIALGRRVPQTEVADVLGITQQHYSKLELGYEPIQQHHLDVLEWRYGWAGISVGASVARRMRMVSCPSVRVGTQAEFLALIGLAELKAKGSEIPQDWRDRWRHRRLWTAAICETSRQVRRMGRGRVA